MSDLVCVIAVMALIIYLGWWCADDGDADSATMHARCAAVEADTILVVLTGTTSPVLATELLRRAYCPHRLRVVGAHARGVVPREYAHLVRANEASDSTYLSLVRWAVDRYDRMRFVVVLDSCAGVTKWWDLALVRDWHLARVRSKAVALSMCHPERTVAGAEASPFLAVRDTQVVVRRSPVGGERPQMGTCASADVLFMARAHARAICRDTARSAGGVLDLELSSRLHRAGVDMFCVRRPITTGAVARRRRDSRTPPPITRTPYCTFAGVDVCGRHRSKRAALGLLPGPRIADVLAKYGNTTNYANHRRGG